MRNIKMVAILACATVWTGGTYAMDLSLNDAIDRIVAESQDLKKADANVKKAEASLDVANANRWFKIETVVYEEGE